MRPPPWSAASFAVNITTLVHLGCAGSNRMEPLSPDSMDGGVQLDAIAPRERSPVISIRTPLHFIVEWTLRLRIRALLPGWARRRQRVSVAAGWWPPARHGRLGTGAFPHHQRDDVDQRRLVAGERGD